jgi:hypothetical protein
VLGDLVGEQHVGRPAGRVRHRPLHGLDVPGRNIGPADPDVIGRDEGVSEVAEPVAVRRGIVVGEGHDLARCRFDAEVARIGQPSVLRPDQPNVVLSGDLGRPVGRPVVDHDHLVVGIVETAERVEARADRRIAVVRADDHGHLGVGRLRCSRNVGEGARHCGQRRLRPPLAIDEAEAPVVHLHTASAPLVRPGEDEGAGAAGRVSRSELPPEHPGLNVLTVPAAVETELRDQKRAVPGDVMETGEVGLQRLVRFEVDVEADDVEERQLEVLGRRVVHVRDDRLAVDLFHRRTESLDVALDLPTPVPTDDRGRNLVADGVAEQRRMAGAVGGFPLHLVEDALRCLPVVEEGDVVFPRESDHHLQAVLVRNIEQPAGRSRVETDRIRAGGCYRREVARDPRRIGIGSPVYSIGKGPVRDAAHVLLLAVDLEKARADARPRRPVGGGILHRLARERPCDRFFGLSRPTLGLQYLSQSPRRTKCLDPPTSPSGWGGV